MAGSPLIALPPDPASPAGATVAGDGWWPAIDRNAARDALRLGEIVTDARLTAALEGAWLTVTSDLAEWAAQLTAGRVDTAPPVPGATSLAEATAGQLAAMLAPHPDTSWRRDFEWGLPYRFPVARPLYTPTRAAWLAGTMTDSVTGTPMPRLVVLFTRAVRFTAAAELVELYRDIGAQAKADIRAEAMLATGSDYRRMAIEAVRDILGHTRVTSELL